MILIDSSVMLDLYDPDSEWYEWSASSLKSLSGSSEFVINPIVYAEVSVRFESVADFDDAFPPQDFLRRAIPFAAALLAGKAHIKYRERGGKRVSTLPDFFIGAHAAVAGYDILARDTRRFSRYFPGVTLIAP